MNAGQLAQMIALRDKLHATEPELDATMLMIVHAWNILGSCRALGYGVVGSIPYTAVVEWCDRRAWANAELTEMIAIAINHLDADRMRRDADRAAHDKVDKPKGQAP